MRTAAALALGVGRRAGAAAAAASRSAPAASTAATRSFAAGSSSDEEPPTGPFTATLFPGDGALFFGAAIGRARRARARPKTGGRLPPFINTHPPPSTQKIPGIGPEIADAVKTIFAAAGVPVTWDEQHVGSTVDPATNSMVSRANLDSVLTHRIGLKGPMATPIGKGHRSLNLTLRKELQLYANVRPCFSLPGYKTRYDNVNLVTIRENTEGEYSGLEHEVVPGVVESLKVITRAASTRVAQYAFKYARDNGRERVTAVHKANIQKLGDGE
jgi:hypothetical protein